MRHFRECNHFSDGAPAVILRAVFISAVPEGAVTGAVADYYRRQTAA